MTNDTFTLERTGGARIGFTNGSWPFGRLRLRTGQLEISNGLRRVRFGPEDVVMVRSYRQFPVLTPGVQVVHRREDVPLMVIFWGFSGVEELVEAIGRGGFPLSSEKTLSAADRLIVERTEQVPFRWERLLATLLLPVLAFGLGYQLGDPDPTSPQRLLLGMALASAGVAVLGLVVLFSGLVQRFVLRPNFTVKDVAGWLWWVVALAALQAGGMGVLLMLDV
ncbi:hypothetical protein QWY85_04415 [Neolewinella lacunae]|uniref:Uncharacterized protein n=1 Tax=Neolewinella lacunae TaxID=1517758 RepID=A0A923PQN8_9BACT|nr:hypothetical protein [Neolewinella lacunae]MBC6996770.1 hypothetical protein [Neolewinella lacunae]MDN3633890.1 hypothetical protein [Neolewinella lacunae]